MDRINLKVSKSAKKLIEKYISEMDLADPITTVAWNDGGISTYHDEEGNEITNPLRPGWGIGWHNPDQVPAEMIQEIDGIKFVFDQGKSSKQLDGKLLDVKNEKFKVVDDG